jgi:hypothetical protein
LDLAGLVSPVAGVSSEELLKRERPDYLVLRTDNAAAFLRSSLREGWFSSTYELLADETDLPSRREFRTYRKKPT